MQSYIVNFITYTMAMIGFIVLALYIYKKSMYSSNNIASRNYLKVESAIKLSATKTVYVLQAGTERFLVAGDTSNTTLLAKLDENNLCPQEENVEPKSINFSSIKEALQKMNNRG